MKIFIGLLFTILLLVGCSSNMSQENTMFDVEGNLKEEYSNAMQQEWCDHNKGKDFAVEQCKEIWESE